MCGASSGKKEKKKKHEDIKCQTPFLLFQTDFFHVCDVCAGIDFSVKTLTVDNSQVAMQMWDTAGQERQVIFSNRNKFN